MTKKLFISLLAVIALLLCSTLITYAADTGTPNLQITANNLTITPTSIKEGTTVTFKAKVENKGTANAVKVPVHFFIGKKEIGVKTLSTIVKNGSATASLSYKIPVGMVGEQKLKVVVGDEAITKPLDINLENLENLEKEKTETSLTQAEKSFTVLATLPDLSVVASDLTITPTTVYTGDKITLKAYVRNIGQAVASPAFKVNFLLNGNVIYTKSFTSLSKGGKSAVIKVYQLPNSLTGNVIFSVQVDPEKKVNKDPNLKNNNAEKSFMVNVPSADISIESFLSSIKNPTPGQKTNLNVKIKNNGSLKINSIELAVYIDVNSQTPTFTQTITSLNPKQATQKSFSWTVPANLSPAVNYPILALVDPNNRINDTNRLNNSKTYLLTLKVPDLTIGKRLDYSLLTLNYPTTKPDLWVRIANDNVQAVNNLKVAMYYYTGDNRATAVKLVENLVGNLAKKQASDVYLKSPTTIDVPLGTVIKLFAKVDSANTILETNEDNNIFDNPRTMIEKPKTLAYPYMLVYVNDEDGNKVNGALVTLKNNVTGAEVSTSTGSNSYQSGAGWAGFENLTNETSYTVTVNKSGFRVITDTFTYNVYLDDTMFRTYNLDTRAVVSGQVKNTAGAVLPNTKVRIDGLGLEANTDSQGKYGFLLNGGTYIFRFVREGYNRAVENNVVVAPLANMTLDKTLTPGTVAYFSGRVTDDEGNGLNSTDIYVNNNMLGATNADGHFNLNIAAGANKKFTFKKPGFVNTEFTETIYAGNEYNYDLVLYKPSTDNHAERGTNIISWHQHEGTPANSFFIPEYNVDVWWGLGHVKMGLDYNKNGDQTKITKLVISVHGDQWECNKVEGEGEIETSAIDIPITIAAGSCSTKLTQMDVYKVAIESGGTEFWSDSSFWTSATDPVNTATKVFTFDNTQVSWDSNFKVKMWLRVQKKAVVGTDGDGAGALVGYHLDKKLITWYPQKPPTTKISTSWKQIGGYFLGILDNPVNAITGFMDIFTVDKYEQYTMEEVLPQDFPGAPPEY